MLVYGIISALGKMIPLVPTTPETDLVPMARMRFELLFFYSTEVTGQHRRHIMLEIIHSSM